MDAKKRTKLEALAKTHRQKQIEIIKSSPANGKLAKANPHIMNLAQGADISGYAAAGLLEAGGLAYYYISVDLLLTNFQGVSAVDFTASGWGAIAGGFECEIAGAFVVNPATIAGPCDFVFAVGAAGEGVVSLTLMSASGAFYGTFLGDVEGIGAAGISSSGTLSVIF